MAKYQFNYWFEWGCFSNSPCLWAADDFTRETFDYCVDLKKLPISAELISFLYALGAKHDEALNWEYPPDPLLWSEEEKSEFYRGAREGYKRLCEELGENFQIRYCQNEE